MADRTRSLTSLLASTSRTVFSTKDFNKVWRYTKYSSLIQRIHYLKRTGKIRALKRGLYAISGRELNELEAANKVRSPSYITFETVLYKEGVIFQPSGRITLASKESEEVAINGITVLFRQMKDSILLNKSGITLQDHYYVASKERALLDILYINPSFHFDNLRSVDFEEVSKLLPIYKRRSLEKVVANLRAYARSY